MKKEKKCENKKLNEKFKKKQEIISWESRLKDFLRAMVLVSPYSCIPRSLAAGSLFIVVSSVFFWFFVSLGFFSGFLSFFWCFHPFSFYDFHFICLLFISFLVYSIFCFSFRFFFSIAFSSHLSGFHFMYFPIWLSVYVYKYITIFFLNERWFFLIYDDFFSIGQK